MSSNRRDFLEKLGAGAIGLGLGSPLISTSCAAASGTTNKPNSDNKKEDGQVVYFNYQMPVFTHDERDCATFRMITSQFCIKNRNSSGPDVI